MARSERGMTLIEALIVVALAGIVLAIAGLWLRPLESPIDTATTLFEGFLRQARLNAIATTSAYRVAPSANNRLGVSAASACSATTWTDVPTMRLNLPNSVTMASTSWQVCFSSRGVSTNNVTVQLQHPTNGSRRVEVLVGGTTRVLP